jgi:hypothetical protein
MPWSRASLLLTNTRAAQAHEVGGFHTRPAITTHCGGAGHQGSRGCSECRGGEKTSGELLGPHTVCSI